MTGIARETWLRAVEEAKPTHKYCWHCKTLKPLNDFSKNKAKSSGCATECKKCAVVRSCRWKENNRERWLKYHRKRAAKNRKRYPERFRKYRARHYERNRERIIERARRYREQNREQINVRACQRRKRLKQEKAT